jgi:hypothetical protein
LAKKANEMIDTAKVAIGNINEATGDLKSITGKIDSGQGTIGALVNATMASLRDVAGEAKVGVVAF